MKVVETLSLSLGFTYEKYFAGKYIGELVRLVLVDLSSQGLLFPECNDKSRLMVQDSFEATDLSDVEIDSITMQSEKTRNILDKMGLEGYQNT